MQNFQMTCCSRKQVKTMFIETNPAPIKAAMYELGLIDTDSLRLPMVPVSDESREKVKAALKEYGIQKPVGAK